MASTASTVRSRPTMAARAVADEFLDIHCDFDLLYLAGERDATRTVYEVSQRAAVEEAARNGCVLRHSDPRETVLKEGRDPVTGRDVLLVGTRWTVDRV